MSTPVSEIPTLISLRSALADDHRRAEREAGFRRRLLNRQLRLGPRHVFEHRLWYGDDGHPYRILPVPGGFEGTCLCARTMAENREHAPYRANLAKVLEVTSKPGDEPRSVIIQHEPTAVLLQRSAWNEIEADWPWTVELPQDIAPPGSRLNTETLRNDELRYRDMAGALEFALERWETRVAQCITDMWELQGAARHLKQDPANDVCDLFDELAPGYEDFFRSHTPKETCPRFTALLGAYLDHLAHGRPATTR